MLGSDLLRAIYNRPGYIAMGLTRQDADITDPDKITRAIVELKPDVVIHCAANTDVDGCQLKPESAFSVNALGTRNVALACQRAGAAMVYISTDYVFDGTKTEPYLEWDRTAPINVYGHSKLAGEWYTASLLDRFYIVRSSWLYGKNGKSFVTTILKLAQERKRLSVVTDQIGSPTYTPDLAMKLVEIVESGRFGIYHVTNSGHCSWYDFARKIIQYAGLYDAEVIPIKSSEFPTPTRRPANSVLRNLALELEGIQLLRPWQEALADFLNEISDLKFESPS